MNALLKRLFDIIGSGIALLLVAPLLLVIAAFIKLDSPGPVIFRQTRLGKGARLFQVYKLRTMVFEAAHKGPCITIDGDSRVTRAGRILRRFALDELPNLFNVLKGEMSIVGPRPEVPEFLPYYTEEQKRVFSVKPGLTDLGTLAFRSEVTLLVGEDAEQVYVREVLPRKLAMSLEYIQAQSFRSDLAITLRTFGRVFFRPRTVGLTRIVDRERVTARRDASRVELESPE